MASAKKGIGVGAGVAIGVAASAVLLGLAWALDGQGDQPSVTEQPGQGKPLPDAAHVPAPHARSGQIGLEVLQGDPNPRPDLFDRTPGKFVPSQGGYDMGYDGGPVGIVSYPDYDLGARERRAGMPRRNLAANPPTQDELFPGLAKSYRPVDSSVIRS